jgi:hypothetical protein
LNKKSDSYVKYATAGDASHHDQDIDDLQDDGHSIDALNSTPNTSTILDCYQDHIASFENLKSEEQIEGQPTVSRFAETGNLQQSRSKDHPVTLHFHKKL